ncbi:hypothetical protein LGL55_02310 [Clostridium tagluense]|uniref:hypothetical protein n=1 Tax=Clostridium tagluense TaxID=360422 RepID=UPI001CF3927A|nr:hypothetical protein [Clostridium tagluense]MCB2309951.1 hypothetical protein [Clostridium tagluense]MCB2314519.1 hypothetical protein [Clostridium tagluense]MCB2319367.1 hypothetical protein [Clostridium tagluense]MCB2324545.1 hypothetical protein [Clostridium tagluense]MCB2329396.1 hypothetical protein [Clostridium tagluense]
MVKKTFIPNWYEDRKSEIWNKKVKLCIKIVLIINIILISLIFNISNGIKDVAGEKASENKAVNIIETVRKDRIIIEKHKEISKLFENNNFTYKNINITKDNLEIDIEVNNYEEYIRVVRLIEDKYSIKKLTPNIKNEGKFNFKVIL